MNIEGLYYGVKTAFKHNAPAILTGLGVSGTITTAVLTARATWKASNRLSEGPPIEQLSKKEIIRECWDLYIPATIAGTVTVGCILGANHVSTKRAAAMASLLAVSERTITDYREKVIEQIGEKKEKNLRDEIVQERIQKTPVSEVVVVGEGVVLYMEGFTGRHFACNNSVLDSAVNKINHKAQREGYATLGDFYFEVGLPQTSNSGQVGWHSDNLLELRRVAEISPDGRPCISIDYNYVDPL